MNYMKSIAISSVKVSVHQNMLKLAQNLLNLIENSWF
jgi:hypothetical protein